MDDLLARMAKVLADIKEVNKHVEWIEARLYEVDKKAEGER